MYGRHREVQQNDDREEELQLGCASRTVGCWYGGGATIPQPVQKTTDMADFARAKRENTEI